MKLILNFIAIICFSFFASAQKRTPSYTYTYPAPVKGSDGVYVANINLYKLSTESDYYNAWIRVKNALKPYNGGIIDFPAGTFIIKTATNNVAWFLEMDNITLRGAGIDKTILTAASTVGCTMSNQSRLVTPYVRGYMLSDSAYTFTYKNSIKKGDNFIVLKSRLFADKIPTGSRMMIVGGAHYYDQEFGELLTVVRKNADTLFIKDPLSGSYASDSAPLATRTLYDFKMPAVRQTVTVKTIKFDYKQTPGRYLNIGDNIFSLYANDSVNGMTLLNIGKGNAPAGTIIPAGTEAMDGRYIALWNHTKNLRIENLTIRGTQNRVLRLDNTYGAVLKNVKVTRSSAIRDGFIYTMDFCRGIKVENCEFTSTINGSGSQISRSSGDISFFKTTFNNIKTDCSEYSFNLSFDSCTFNMSAGPDYAFILGNTVRKSYVRNNTFNVDSVGGVILGNEIQALNRIQREYSIISGNTFRIKRYASAIVDLPQYGSNWFVNNKIVTDSAGIIYNLSGSLNRIFDGSGWYMTDNHIENNTIVANVSRYFIYGGLYSGKINGNTVINTSIAMPNIFGGWVNISAATVSNNNFKGFKTTLVAPASAVLINNTIQ